MTSALHPPGNARPTHGGRAMLAGLLPASACAETFSDAPESTMYSAEAAVVANAVAERRREFGTVRYCARKALQELRVRPVAILPDADGAPRWPAGVVGSMTHCTGYRAAAVARSGDVCALGIDAEPHDALPSEVRDLVLRDEESARLSAFARVHPQVNWDRIVFSAKEAVYKAWFSLTRRWLDFADVSTTVQVDGRFSARVLPREARLTSFGLDVFEGRWRVGRGLVVTATSVARPGQGVLEEAA